MSAGNLALMLADTAARCPDEPAMRWRTGHTWTSSTYAEMQSRVRAAAGALVAAGVEAGDRIGLQAQNCPEWAIIDFAVLSVGAVTVPIYPTTTTSQAAYIVNDAGITLLFVGDVAQRDRMTGAWASMAGLQRIEVLDDLDDFLVPGQHPSLTQLAEARLASVSGSDVATLVYTSGTTGDPKGVMLTHGNFLHQVTALRERFTVGPGDTSLCFLPLSHAYERGWSYFLFSTGAENCYLRDPRGVIEAMAEVRPTTMVTVPRLLEKIHEAARDRVAHGSATRARMFAWALRIGAEFEDRRRAGRAVGPVLRARHAVADRLVLRRIRDVVGGRKNVLASGGAPLAQSVEEFFLAAGILVCQGYGLTETAALLTCNHPAAFRLGTVGTPVLGSEVRIMTTGEIEVRGGSVMAGYYGKPAETAAAFHDGWLRTGDVGSVDADGFLTVTDRIKDLIITSQGKNVAPQHIETLLADDPLIEQIVIIGDRRSYLSALVEPAFPALERLANERGIAYSSRAQLVTDPYVHDLFAQRIRERSCDLAGYEQVRRFTVLAHEFSQSKGQVTPTMKLRRAAIENEFAGVIESMYDAPRESA
jgi:long-chain acyl-CoA synthetase